MIIESSSSKFAEDVLLVKGEVLVDFWAEWCGPCKAMQPVLESVLDRVKVVKINVDDNSGLAATYSIRSIPTMILFKDGQEVDRIVGAMSKEALLNKLALE